MAQIGYGETKSAGVPTPKADSINSCLDRISSLVGTLGAHASSLENFADNLTGSEPAVASPIKDGGDLETEPAHALFRAHKIETTLQTIIDRQEYQMRRIQNAIG